MAKITKAQFIAVFQIVMKQALEQELKLEEGEENDYINAAYEIIEKKLRHIKGGGNA